MNASYCDQIKDGSGQAIVNTDGVSTLVVCDQGCETCSPTNPGSCAACMPGYTMVAATDIILAHCIACVGHCLTCTNNATSTCTSCFSGYFLVNGACSNCSSSCVSCDQNNLHSCTSCPSNNVHKQNGECAAVSSESTCG